MNGHTKCPKCLATVRVLNGLITWHKGPERFQKDADGKHKHVRLTCIGHKTPALWAENGKGAELNAMARDPRGLCMACWQVESNPDCPQCNYEKRNAEN